MAVKNYGYGYGREWKLLYGSRNILRVVSGSSWRSSGMVTAVAVHISSWCGQ